MSTVTTVTADAHPVVIDPAVSASGLYRFFHAGEEEVQALRGVSVQLRSGELTALVGPSGSGKSTLLSLLAGLDEPDGGTVHVSGQRLSRRPEAQRARLRAQLIGVLTQRDNLVAHLSVRQNLQLVRKLAGARRAGRGTAPLLAELGLADRADALPGTLSGGETVRAGLAVALANDPAVVLADEPTGELDSASEAEVLELLRRTARRGTAVLVASHSPAVAAAADRVLTLRDGMLQR